MTERGAAYTAHHRHIAFLILRLCSPSSAISKLRFSGSGASSSLSRLRARALPSPVNLPSSASPSVSGKPTPRQAAVTRRRDKTPWQAATRFTGSRSFFSLRVVPRPAGPLHARYCYVARVTGFFLILSPVRSKRAWICRPLHGLLGCSNQQSASHRRAEFRTRFSG